MSLDQSDDLKVYHTPGSQKEHVSTVCAQVNNNVKTREDPPTVAVLQNTWQQ